MTTIDEVEAVLSKSTCAYQYKLEERGLEIIVECDPLYRRPISYIVRNHRLKNVVVTPYKASEEMKALPRTTVKVVSKSGLVYNRMPNKENRVLAKIYKKEHNEL